MLAEMASQAQRVLCTPDMALSGLAHDYTPNTTKHLPEAVRTHELLESAAGRAIKTKMMHGSPILATSVCVYMYRYICTSCVFLCVNIYKCSTIDTDMYLYTAKDRNRTPIHPHKYIYIAQTLLYTRTHSRYLRLYLFEGLRPQACMEDFAASHCIV